MNNGNNIIADKIESSIINQTLSINLTDEQFKEWNKLNSSPFNSKNDLEKKISEAYDISASIINNDDSNFILSKTDRETLKIQCDFLFKIKDIFLHNFFEDRMIFYRNLFAILLKIDGTKIKEVYEKLDIDIKNQHEIKFLYCLSLLEVNIDTCVNSLLELINNNINPEYIYILLLCYLKNEKYNSIIETHKKYHNIMDEHGKIASIVIIARNNIKKIKLADLKKYNKKYNNMPLYYGVSACIIKENGGKKHDYVNQFNKALKNLEHSNVIVLNSLYRNSLYLQESDKLINIMKRNNSSIWLKICEIEYLTSKKVINEENFARVDELKNSLKLYNEFIDLDYVEGMLNLSSKRYSIASKSFLKSYQEKKVLHILYKYALCKYMLNEVVDDQYINTLFNSKNLIYIELAIEFYLRVNKNELVKQGACKLLYLSPNNERKKYYEKFVYYTSLIHSDEIKKYTTVNSTCIVEVIDNYNTIKRILIDDEIENINNLFNLDIYNKFSDIGIELTNKKINDLVIINNKEYNITKIIDKYLFFYQSCLSKIDGTGGIQLIKGNVSESVEEIKEMLKKHKTHVKYMLDCYNSVLNNEIGLPICSFEKNVSDVLKYTQIMLLLLNEPNQNFFVGEINYTADLKNGFVLDITSLAILNIFDALHILEKYDLKNIYISQTTYNSIKNQYTLLLQKHGKTEMNIGYDMEDNLFKTDIKIDDQINLLKNIIKLCNKLTILDMEEKLCNFSEFDDFITKIHFDSALIAKEKNIPYIVDDLFLRKLFNAKYQIKTTNCMHLFVDQLKNENNINLIEFKQIVNLFKKIVKCNYITLLDNVSIGLLLYNASKLVDEEVIICFREMFIDLLKNDLNYDNNKMMLSKFKNITKDLKEKGLETINELDNLLNEILSKY